jgi:dethiobiotin synthetase
VHAGFAVRKPSRRPATKFRLASRPGACLRVLFITGTDTGVGKTLLTALLLSHLRQGGCQALALKPFSSGNQSDAQLLHALAGGDLTLDEINPFHFSEPVAPLVAARRRRRLISLDAVLAHIDSICSRHLRLANPVGTRAKIENQKSATKNAPTLLIEGVGGLLVPLGDGYTVLDLITELARQCGSSSHSTLEVLVVSRNQLGTLNHTLLTVGALRRALASVSSSNFRVSLPRVVLMAARADDASCASNPRMLSELLLPSRLIQFPFLKAFSSKPAAVAAQASRLRPLLARVLD